MSADEMLALMREREAYYAAIQPPVGDCPAWCDQPHGHPGDRGWDGVAKDDWTFQRGHGREFGAVTVCIDEERPADSVQSTYGQPHLAVNTAEGELITREQALDLADNLRLAVEFLDSISA